MLNDFADARSAADAVPFRTRTCAPGERVAHHQSTRHLSGDPQTARYFCDISAGSFSRRRASSFENSNFSGRLPPGRQVMSNAAEAAELSFGCGKSSKV